MSSITNEEEDVIHVEVANITDNKERWIQARYLVTFAAFLMNGVCFLTRVNLSVAIVAISSELSPQNNQTEQYAPQYDWDASIRSKILSSFFWGFILTQVSSAYLSQRYGSKIMLLLAVFISVFATFLFVPAAALGWQYICATRFIMGLGQGAMMPSSHNLLAHWSPPNERGRMAVYVYSGHVIGSIVAMSGSGYLCATSGWPSVFYVSGSIGVICMIVWLILADDSPATSRYATIHEVQYIENSINAAANSRPHISSKDMRIPWCAMLTSVPMWALLVAHSAQAWGFWTLATEIPSYMSGVLNFQLKKNGFLSALPFVAMWFSSLIFSWASDLILRKGIWSIGTSRKVANSIGHYGAAICLIVLGYAGANETFAVFTLTFTLSINAGVMVGYLVNHLDLSPNFAGTMMGITNCASNLMSILGPLLVGYIVTENDNAAQWRLVFLISAGFYVVGNTIFVVFGSGEVQRWNNPEWKQNVSQDIGKPEQGTPCESTTQKMLSPPNSVETTTS